MNKLDDAKRNHEISAEMFEQSLRYFVCAWAPKDGYDLHQFHMDLTRLMVDAMRHKTNSIGIGFSALETYADIATRPLAVIHQEKHDE